MKISIIYWSGTGNTEQMANLINEGASEVAEVSLKNVSQASKDDVSSCDLLVLGCPSMGDEVLEEDEFEPFISSIEGLLSGKKVALFGSYGWGDGQWMRDFEARIKSLGAEVVCDPLIVNEAPAGSDVENCKTFGKKLS